MSNLSLFMKRNKAVKENVTFAATKSLCDESGDPLLWEIKPISTKEDERIRAACTREVLVKGKMNYYRPKMDVSEYTSKMIVESVVVPDLLNEELQDSYGVKTPEDLLKEMVSDPGEYNDFAAFVQKFNGFNISLEEEVDEVKNS